MSDWSMRLLLNKIDLDNTIAIIIPNFCCVFINKNSNLEV